MNVSKVILCYVFVVIIPYSTKNIDEFVTLIKKLCSMHFLCIYETVEVLCRYAARIFFVMNILLFFLRLLCRLSCNVMQCKVKKSMACIIFGGKCIQKRNPTHIFILFRNKISVKIKEMEVVNVFK